MSRSPFQSPESADDPQNGKQVKRPGLLAETLFVMAIIGLVLALRLPAISSHEPKSPAEWASDYFGLGLIAVLVLCWLYLVVARIVQFFCRKSRQ